MIINNLLLAIGLLLRVDDPPIILGTSGTDLVNARGHVDITNKDTNMVIFIENQRLIRFFSMKS